jgi:hypothetical protein
MNVWHPNEPPLNERVLALDKYGQCVIGRYVDHHIMGKIWQVGDYCYSCNIVSWMPLPTVPNPLSEPK